MRLWLAVLLLLATPSMAGMQVRRGAMYSGSAVCGNGVRDGSDQCDGSDLGTGTCVNQGYASGTLACTGSCIYNFAGCVASVCGNDVLETGEVCDTTKFGADTCTAHGCTGGSLTCSGSCLSVDVSACTGCPTGGSFTSVGSLLAISSGTAVTSYAPNVTATLDSGNVGVCFISKDDESTGTTDGDASEITSITDAASNTWTKAIEWCNLQNASLEDGECVDIWYTKATSNLTSGSAITFNFAASTTRKSVSCWEFSISGGSTISVAAGSGGVSNDNGDPGSITVNTTVNREHLFLRATGMELPLSTATYTGTASYTEFTGVGGGSGSNGGRINGEFRILTASSDSTDPSLTTTTDCTSAMVALNVD